jgi:serine/threonine protein kinase
MTLRVRQQIDKYRIEALLGQGGMGTVYKAYDIALQRVVALKMIRPDLAQRPEFQQRFMQEAQSAAGLKHPSIVTIHNIDDSQGILFIDMAFIDGPSLSQYLQRVQEHNSNLDLKQALLLLAQMADALSYAHRQGVIHRDVKPANVLLEPLKEVGQDNNLAARAIVTDFGLAKLQWDGVQTTEGTFMGTLPYMSPEQCSDRELDGRSDIYSTGIMLFQLTTGQLPFDIKTPAEAVFKHLNEEPPDPGNVRPGVPDAVTAIIKKAIAKDPSNRYQTGEALAEALREAAVGLTEAEITGWASAQSVVSLATQLMPFEKVPLPSRLGRELTAMPGLPRLLVARSGESAKSILLEKGSLTIGTSKDCDIVLNAHGVSRYHVRIIQTTNGGWSVMDLGSTNGTYLESSLLLPGVVQIWESGQTLHVGPYFLNWYAAEGKAIGELFPRSSESFSGMASTPGGTAVYNKSGDVRIIIEPTHVEIAPGGRVDIQVDLFNEGREVNHFRLEIEGLPERWVTYPKQDTRLMPGRNSSLPLSIHPPLESSSTAGKYDFTIIVHSTSKSEENATISSSVDVKAFERYSLEMKPLHFQNRERGKLFVHNKGNAEMRYKIAGSDPAEAVEFQFTPGRLTLAPEEDGVVEISLAAQRRPFLGRTKTLPFKALVNPDIGERQSLDGMLDARPVIPPWLLSLLMILGIIICLVSGVLFNDYNIKNARGTQTAVAEVTQQQIAAETREALQAIAVEKTQQADNANVATVTSLTLTAEVAGDNDEDGLSNAQELAGGTDPENDDTDGDGLNDGQEVNQYGTNPKQEDSDGDTLVDGAEIEHGTSPTNPDSDGDGTPDGVEVDAGTDPLRAPTATPNYAATERVIEIRTATAEARAILTAEAQREETAIAIALLTNEAIAAEEATEEAQETIAAAQVAIAQAQAATSEAATVEADENVARLAIAQNWSIILEDSFDRDNDWCSGLVDNDYIYGTIETSGGKFIWEMTALQGFFWFCRNQNFPQPTNFFSSADFQLISGSETSRYGLVFRAQDGDNFIVFEVDDSGWFQISLQIEGRWETLVDWTESQAVKPDRLNTLAVIGENTHYTLFINGDYVGEFVEDRLRNGLGGVSMSLNEGETAIIHFDNLTVRSPDPPYPYP